MSLVLWITVTGALARTIAYAALAPLSTEVRARRLPGAWQWLLLNVRAARSAARNADPACRR